MSEYTFAAYKIFIAIQFSNAEKIALLGNEIREIDETSRKEIRVTTYRYPIRKTLKRIFVRFVLKSESKTGHPVHAINTIRDLSA